jgi:hypothetical protein
MVELIIFSGIVGSMRTHHVRPSTHNNIPTAVPSLAPRANDKYVVSNQRRCMTGLSFSLSLSHIYCSG